VATSRWADEFPENAFQLVLYILQECDQHTEHSWGRNNDPDRLLTDGRLSVIRLVSRGWCANHDRAQSVLKIRIPYDGVATESGYGSDWPVMPDDAQVVISRLISKCSGLRTVLAEGDGYPCPPLTQSLATFTALAKCTRLARLLFNGIGTELLAVGLPLLTSLTSLTELHLGRVDQPDGSTTGSAVGVCSTNSCLGEITQHLPRLERLSLESTCPHLATGALMGLTHLTWQNSSTENTVYFQTICLLTNLVYLDVSRDRGEKCSTPSTGNDGHVLHFEGSTESCMCPVSRGADIGSHLAKLTNLVSLKLNCWECVHDGVLEGIARLTRLQSLGLARCGQVTDAGVSQLSTLSDLTLLDLWKCSKVTDLGVSALACSLRDLQELDLNGCDKLTVNCLKALGDLTALHTLSLDWALEEADEDGELADFKADRPSLSVNTQINEARNQYHPRHQFSGRIQGVDPLPTYPELDYPSLCYSAGYVCSECASL
jgi:hypothetical protein